MDESDNDKWTINFLTFLINHIKENQDRLKNININNEQMFESNKNHIGEACQNDSIGHDDESIINNNKMDMQTRITRGGNHKRAPWRNNSDGAYNNKPIDDTYFRDYYRTKLCEK